VHALHVLDGERGACLGGRSKRIGKRAGPERLHRKAAISMRVQIDQTGQRQPARRCVRHRLDAGNQPAAQAQDDGARAVRKRNGIEPQLVHVQ
jgi:hypothetical protein